MWGSSCKKSCLATCKSGLSASSREVTIISCYGRRDINVIFLKGEVILLGFSREYFCHSLEQCYMWKLPLHHLSQQVMFWSRAVTGRWLAHNLDQNTSCEVKACTHLGAKFSLFTGGSLPPAELSVARKDRNTLNHVETFCVGINGEPKPEHASNPWFCW